MKYTRCLYLILVDNSFWGENSPNQIMMSIALLPVRS